MPHVTLFRRHRPACAAGHPVDSYNTEAEERRKNWQKCSCKIYAHGTLGGVSRKLATKARDWERAREVLAPYLAAGRWDIQPPPDAPPPPPPSPSRDVPPGAPPEERKSGLSIADAVKACLADHRASGSAQNTVKKYREVLGKLERFSQQLGLVSLDEWMEPGRVRAFRNSWNVSPLTASKNLGLVKAFFEIFVEDGTLDKNPARIRSRRNRVLRKGDQAAPQKNPYTDEELKRMLDACASLGRTSKREWPKKRGGRQVVAITEYRDYHRKWTGEDLADFIQISVFTGLRISDVATFDVARLDGAEVRLRATKNGEWISVWIPEWLRTVIRARAARLGPLIFGAHATTDLNVITDVWRRKLKRVWDDAGPWKAKPTHHRFRHTFVRLLLERHVPVPLVASLAGDTEDMIYKHYSGWCPGRQESASRILAEAFRDVPRLHGR